MPLLPWGHLPCEHLLPELTVRRVRNLEPLCPCLEHPSLPAASQPWVEMERHQPESRDWV